jgi:2-hydroxy-6-oxonona-2,4-dienedioate hydrolase
VVVVTHYRTSFSRFRSLACKRASADTSKATAISIRKTLVTLLSLAALGGAAWAHRAFRRDLEASCKRLAGASRVAATRAGAIEYAEAGTGPPLLIAHGAGGGFDQGLDCGGTALAERGFRAIAVSRFGYLGTPLPADASAPAQADAYAALMDRLGIERAAILGVSAGAPSAMQFAIRHKDRCAALVLLVPMTYQPHDATAVPTFSPAAEKLLLTIVGSNFVYWMTSKFARDLLIKLVLATPPELVHAATPGERARVDRIVDRGMPIGLRIRGILNDSRICGSLPRYKLDAVRAPTLIISCRDDRYGSFAMARHTADQIPGAQFIGYDRGGHVWVGHHDELLDEMAGFLRSHDPSARALSMAIESI